MKKKYLIIGCLAICCSGYAQQLSQVTFSNGSVFSWFSILTNQNILIRISDDGKILEYGTEEHSYYNNNYFAPKLIHWAGSVNYYDQSTDSAYRGKIKNIGSCFFTYYPSYDNPQKAGKIKSAGSLSFDYYEKFQDALLAGKIKNIGTNTINYYTSFDNDAVKGKLKMIGTTVIAYYSSFDDTLIKGKVKSIGSARYIWYTSSDRREYQGAIKSGYQRQLINGITFILW
jgi:hypothetical protein